MFLSKLSFSVHIKVMMYVHSHGQCSHYRLERGEEEREVVCSNTTVSARGRCTPDWCGLGKYCIRSSGALESYSHRIIEWFGLEWTLQVI